jgi:transketolase
MNNTQLDELCINTIRFLSVDAVQKAESGHPGLPLGSASMAYVLWNRFLRFNPRDPFWPNRDRFVLSAGHGCALLYSLLFLTGYDLSLGDLKRFRQWQSRTPGHPEYRKTPGVEATTGPLGQGFANAVGMAIAEASLAARFNKSEFPIIDHFTYVLASDGDLMEGIASEAASLAGHLQLGKLIVLYSNNNITIEGGTGLTFTEDRTARFAAYGWHVQEVQDGNDVQAVHDALNAAQKAKHAPSFISVHDHIGYGSPHKQDTAAAHGEPLGQEEVRLTKEKLGWPPDKTFYVPEEALDHFRQAVDKGAGLQQKWDKLLDRYADANADAAAEFRRIMQGKLPAEWDKDLPVFKPDKSGMATRIASGKALNAVAKRLPELMGGAADLAPSTFTLVEDAEDFEPNNYSGRNMRFGVREHAMGGILNGMAYHGGFIPYGATFLIFSDYMRPSIRLAALSQLPVIYVFTHDSIGLGEDGPTHQAVEQLLGLRSIPNMIVIRPADANETAAAWKLAVIQTHRPAALALTRQKIPVLDPEKYPHISEGVLKGGYILSKAGKDVPDLVMVATGSEVHLVMEAQPKLEDDGIYAQIVSMPCWEVFMDQSENYRKELFPDDIPVLSVEAGVSLGWQSYLGKGADNIGVNKFGSSAPGSDVLKNYGFNVDNVRQRALELVKKHRK